MLATQYQNQAIPYQSQATPYQSQATLYQNQVGDYAQQVYASQYCQQPLVQSMFAGPSNQYGLSNTFVNSFAPEAPAALPPSTNSKHRFRSPTSRDQLLTTMRSSALLLGGNRKRALEWHVLPGEFPTQAVTVQPH